MGCEPTTPFGRLAFSVSASHADIGQTREIDSRGVHGRIAVVRALGFSAAPRAGKRSQRDAATPIFGGYRTAGQNVAGDKMEARPNSS